MDKLALGQELRYDIAAACEGTGLPEEELRHIWRSLGFPDPTPGEPVFSDVDLGNLAAVADLMHSGVVSPEVTYGMTRVIGSSMARIASALVDAVSARADRPARDDLDGCRAQRGPRAGRQPGGWVPADVPRGPRPGLAASPPGRRSAPVAAGGCRRGAWPHRGVRGPRRLHGPGAAGERRGAGGGGRPVRAARLRRGGRRRRSRREDDRRRGHVHRRRPRLRGRDRARAWPTPRTTPPSSRMCGWGWRSGRSCSERATPSG